MDSTASLLAIYYVQRERLLKYVIRLLGDGEQAQDIIQDMWLKLAQSQKSKIASPSSYLFRMAHNLVIDHLRTHKLSINKLEEFYLLSIQQSTLTSDSLTLDERQQILHKMLDSQPKRLQQIFCLYYKQGYTMVQVADVAGISLGQVHRLLNLFEQNCRCFLSQNNKK
ncbi:sigma-70 family RNA polymerase sigma factor [Pseudomonas sp. F1_0610]|uniref:RNA polymerase sigma factor n=1 Tax=Pseudomonas sp. F1_0610 TaxID=3114284 RepID=UPI0039C0B3E4